MTALEAIDFSRARMLPGKIVLDLDPLPGRLGELFLPDRDMKANADHIAHTATVRAIGRGPFLYSENGKQKLYHSPDENELRVGARVVFRLLMSDLNKKRVITDVRRIDAVIESE